LFSSVRHGKSIVPRPGAALKTQSAASLSKALEWFADEGSPELAERWEQALVDSIGSLSYFRERCSVAEESQFDEQAIPVRYDTERGFGGNFDRQASATNSVLFLGLSPTKANRTVSFFSVG
jgi:hypothetical protein